MELEELARRLLDLSEGDHAEEWLLLREGSSPIACQRFRCDRSTSVPCLSWEALAAEVVADEVRQPVEPSWLYRLRFHDDAPEGHLQRSVTALATIERARIIAAMALFLMRHAYGIQDVKVDVEFSRDRR